MHAPATATHNRRKSRLFDNSDPIRPKPITDIEQETTAKATRIGNSGIPLADGVARGAPRTLEIAGKRLERHIFTGTLPRARALIGLT